MKKKTSAAVAAATKKKKPATKQAAPKPKKTVKAPIKKLFAREIRLNLIDDLLDEIFHLCCHEVAEVGVARDAMSQILSAALTVSNQLKRESQKKVAPHALHVSSHLALHCACKQAAHQELIVPLPEDACSSDDEH